MTMMTKAPPVAHFYDPSLYAGSLLGGVHHHPLLTFLANAQRRYGDIFMLDLGIKRALVVTHPRYARHILQSHAANYRKGGALMTPLRTISGAGVTTSSGQLWREQRRTIQPFFQRQHLIDQLPTILRALMKSLDAYMPQPLAATPINGSALLTILTAQTTATLIGQVALPIDEIQQLSTAVGNLTQGALHGMLNPRLPTWLPLPGRRRYDQAVCTIHRVIETLVDLAQTCPPEQTTLFAALHQRIAPLAAPHVARQQLHDEILALFIAGYETTATALNWTCFLLSQHPAVLATLEEEIQQVVGDRLPTYADLAALKYGTQVLAEALRLYPPSWRLSRVAAAADEIDGVHVLPGQSVLTLVYLIHRHPGFWSEPERFIPERFADERSMSPVVDAWLPFGLGSRKCVGQELALLEMKLILVILLQRYHLVPEPIRHPGIQLAMTLKPSADLWFTLTTRALAA